MKVILQQDVKGQGKKGQLVDVSDGYARNFLLPKKLAVIANAENVNTMKQQEKARKAQEAAEKAEADIRLPEQTVSGPVHIAAGETARVGIIGRTMIEVQKRYPGITLNLYSGNSADLMDGLVRGQYDFFLECEVKTHVDMNTLILPERDVWGIATRKDNPLAKLERVRPDDLVGHPLITSQQGMTRDPLRTWARDVVDQITVTATYNLPLNCRYLAESGMGSIITYGDIFEDLPDSSLVFIPLDPPIESTQGIVWRKTLPTRQAQVFLDTLRELIAAE